MVLDINFIFIITYVMSTLFAMAGIGSAVALVPILNMIGLELNLAKSIGLFINTSSTVSASYMNFRRGVLDVKFAIPLIISSAITAPFGAYYSQFIPQKIILFLLSMFVISSATILLINKKTTKLEYKNNFVLFIIGSIIGFISGVIGIGGGAYLVLSLILLGYDAKKVAYVSSLVIPFSTFSAFLMYHSYVQIDYVLLGVCTLGAILGGLSGNYIMHYNLNSNHIKKLIAILLYCLGIKILISLL